MKTKYITLIISLFTVSMTAFGQLKVDQNGRIGMGTNWPNSGYKLHVAGNILSTSYPANPYFELRMKVGNGWPGCELGATSDILAFWTTEYSYAQLRASSYVQVSDSTLKSNIQSINSPLARIMKVRPSFYSIEDNKIDGETGEKIIKTINQFGFLSQQIRDLFPEVNITTTGHDGLILMDYSQMIPIAVAAIQDQQKIIDSLKKEITTLKDQINSNNFLGIDNSSLSNNDNILNQNTPNPFSEKCEVKFSISDQNFRNASIVIFDLNGLLIKKYEINRAGKGSIQIDGNELKAGMYIYTLIVNQREIDSKRMILLN